MKFSLRDLFRVTVIVATGLGWWIDHRVSCRSLSGVESGYRERSPLGESPMRPRNFQNSCPRGLDGAN